MSAQITRSKIPTNSSMDKPILKYHEIDLNLAV